MQSRRVSFMQPAIVLVAVASLIATASPALADSARHVASGAGALGPDTITSVNTAGGNAIVEGTSSGVLTGTFQAAFTESFRDVVHADGSVDISATVSLQGRTPCGSGRWTQSLVVHVAPDGSFAGQTAAIDIGSGTVAVQTEYVFRGAGNAFTYAGSYSCA